MYSDRRGYGQNPPRTKPSRQKTPWQKPPDKSPREQLRENLYRRLLSGFFVLGLLWPMLRGSTLAKNSVKYFMDGPLRLSNYCLTLRCLARLLLQGSCKKWDITGCYKSVYHAVKGIISTLLLICSICCVLSTTFASNKTKIQYNTIIVEEVIYVVIPLTEHSLQSSCDPHSIWPHSCFPDDHGFARGLSSAVCEVCRSNNWRHQLSSICADSWQRFLPFLLYGAAQGW